MPPSIHLTIPFNYVHEELESDGASETEGLMERKSDSSQSHDNKDHRK